VIHLRDKKLSPIAAAFRAFLLENGATIMNKALGGTERIIRSAK
jgi:LysR family transcriptional regulator, low CO2-responsive transcriptional regulator